MRGQKIIQKWTTQVMLCLWAVLVLTKAKEQLIRQHWKSTCVKCKTNKSRRPQKMRKLWHLKWICSRIERQLDERLKINQIALLRFQSIWNKMSLNLYQTKIQMIWIIIQICQLQLLELSQIKFWIKLNNQKLRIIKLYLRNQIHKVSKKDHIAWKCDLDFSKVSTVHFQRLNSNLRKLTRANKKMQHREDRNLLQRKRWRRILINQTLMLTELHSTFWKRSFQTLVLITKKLV